MFRQLLIAIVRPVRRLAAWAAAQPGDGPISAGDVLLHHFKGWVLKLCVRLGLLLSLLAILIGAASSTGSLRRGSAAALMVVLWVSADRWRRHWVPNVFADRRIMFVLAAGSIVPFAIDGHAQSDVFMALAPLAGIAAVACRRRDVAIFTVVWLAAYLLGTLAGGGPSALIAGAHRFDAAMQAVFILSSCSMSAFAVVRYRRFVDQIPARIAEARAAEDSTPTSAQGGADTSGDRRPRRRPAVGEPLTVGEEAVLGLLAGDRTRGEIALLLGLKPEGVRARIMSAMKKYGVRSQYAAVARFVADGGRRA